MPHLLIGGSTNSGKSICLNTLIASLVYRATPHDVRLLMIDPKRVELSLWEGIPHLLHPVVKDVKQSAGIFRSAIKEMERRYDLFAALGTRNIDGYNQKVPDTERLPYIVLIVDELADLMMQQGAEVENQICRLAQSKSNRYSPRYRYPTPFGRYYHRNHQGEHLVTYSLCCRLSDRLAYYSG